MKEHTELLRRDEFPEYHDGVQFRIIRNRDEMDRRAMTVLAAILLVINLLVWAEVIIEKLVG